MKTKPDLWPDDVTDVTERARTADELLEVARLGKLLTAQEEYVIAASASASLAYAREICNKRFPAGEPAIAKLPFTAIKYAKTVLGNDPIVKNSLRFPEAEKAISDCAIAVLDYATTILGYGELSPGSRRFPDGEFIFAVYTTDALIAISYARDIIRAPWHTIDFTPLGETVEGIIEEQKLTEVYRSLFPGYFPANGF